MSNVVHVPFVILSFLGGVFYACGYRKKIDPIVISDSRDCAYGSEYRTNKDYLLISWWSVICMQSRKNIPSGNVFV